MRTIGIATYTLKIRQKRSDEFEPLGGIDGRFALGQLLAEYLESISRADSVDEDSQNVLQAVRCEQMNDNFYRIMRAGEYGYAAEGINVHSCRVTYQRTAEDAEGIPFYYRAFLPEINDLGILVLQRYGPYGVFTASSKGFRLHLDRRLPDHIVEYNGTTRVIDINDQSNLAPYIDATESVTLGASGHPTFESVDAYCAKLVTDLLRQLGRA